MSDKSFKATQYACAVLLILSSIAMVAYQIITIFGVASSLLIYIGQAFLLAGSIFGLDYYVHLLARKLDNQKPLHDGSSTKPSL